MHLFSYLALLAAAHGVNAQLVNPNKNTFGNVFNFWTKTTDGWDLTRGNATNAITLPLPDPRGQVMIQPASSALVIIDMQNFFLVRDNPNCRFITKNNLSQHPDLGGDPLGRAIIPTTINMIHAFRAKGMKVFWTNWGLTDFDLISMPPAFFRGFSSDGTSATSFGSDMGTIQGNISVGRKLMRGSWNAQPFGDLLDEQLAGVAHGSDFYFNKNRLSGMWGTSTPMQTFLQDNLITTLFFGGVNIDQCVWGTLLDSYYKGYDVILVDDISATTSPSAATAMVDFNAALDGWRANSTDILPALV
ncbi:Isochorismatase hydrolase [Mycena maculata]|uniref:Isochorismatase hydrolase n=1 Tax=Mycena maculata TaxID=230809 RepID=A0AAD7HJQ5_9AGAR|nr:Isochorismatase hydrolase [Mycena maculata]